MDLSSVSALIVYLGLVAAVAERITAAVKGVADLSKITNEKWRAIAIQGIAFSAAMLAAVLNPPTDVLILKALPFSTSIIIVGLLGSAGSNVWHDALSSLAAFKLKQQAGAHIAQQEIK